MLVNYAETLEYQNALLNGDAQPSAVEETAAAATTTSPMKASSRRGAHLLSPCPAELTSNPQPPPREPTRPLPTWMNVSRAASSPQWTALLRFMELAYGTYSWPPIYLFALSNAITKQLAQIVRATLYLWPFRFWRYG